MRQEHYRPASVCREPARVHQIIFRKRRHHWRSKPQKFGMSATNFFFEPRVRYFARTEHLDSATLQPEIRRLLVSVKVVACLNNVIVEAGKILQYIARGLTSGSTIAAGPAVRPVQPPVQRTDDAIVVHRRELGLPVIHPLSVARGHSILEIQQDDAD